jgi:hypothetical protein
VNCLRLKASIMLVSLCLAVAASPSGGQAPDIAAPMPAAGKVEFDNAAMTVVRIHMAPHEKTPMHDIVSPRLVIWLTDAHLQDTGPDGTVSEYKRPAGSIDWITPRRHRGENLSDQSLDFLAIIPKAHSTSGAHGKPRH